MKPASSYALNFMGWILKLITKDLPILTTLYDFLI